MTKQLNSAEQFRAWCYLYLTHHFKSLLGPLHDEWFSLIDHKRVCISAPRGFAKSHFWTLYYPLFKALSCPGTSIIIVSASATLAEKFLMKIKRELELNSDLIAQYGTQETKTWRNNLLHLSNGSMLEAIGANGRIRGNRPDIVIMDDLENDMNVRSEDIQLHMVHWFKEAVINTLTVDGQIIIVGTPLHPMSFLSRILDKDISVLHSYDKWVIKHFGARGEDGKSVWPQHYTTAWLDEKEDEIGPAAFAQEYMGNPVPDELRPFKPEMIQWYKELPKRLIFTTTVDPAATTGNESDYTAIVTVGTDADGTMYVADAIRGRWEPDEIIEKIFQQYLTYGSRTIAIEEVAFSNMLRKQLEKEMLRRHLPLNVVALKKDNSSMGIKKTLRIEGLQPHIKAGWMLFSHAHKDLETELLCFPGRHDDLLDALAYQLDIIQPASKGNTEREYIENAPAGSYLDWDKYCNPEKYLPKCGKRKTWHI